MLPQQIIRVPSNDADSEANYVVFHTCLSGEAWLPVIVNMDVLDVDRCWFCD